MRNNKHKVGAFRLAIMPLLACMSVLVVSCGNAHDNSINTQTVDTDANHTTKPKSSKPSTPDKLDESLKTPKTIPEIEPVKPLTLPKTNLLEKPEPLKQREAVSQDESVEDNNAPSEHIDDNGTDESEIAPNTSEHNDQSKPETTTASENDMKKDNNIEGWIRTIFIPIILWGMARVIIYNVNRYHLIKTLYADISQQVLIQVEWLARIELWLLKELGKEIPLEYQAESYKLFTIKPNTFNVYNEALGDIKKYLWGKEIDKIHKFYEKMSLIQNTMERALSFQKEDKILSFPTNFPNSDPDHLTIKQNEKRILFNVEAAYRESKEILMELLDIFFKSSIQERSLKNILNNINNPNEVIPLRYLAGSIFFSDKWWYPRFLGIPIAILISILLVFLPFGWIILASLSTLLLCLSIWIRISN